MTSIQGDVEVSVKLRLMVRYYPGLQRLLVTYTHQEGAELHANGGGASGSWCDGYGT